MNQPAIAAAEAALAAPITAASLTGAVVENRPSAAKVVISARIDPQDSEALLTEAARRNTSPSTIVAELVAEGLRRRAETAAEVVTVNVGDLHRAIDAAVRRAA